MEKTGIAIISFIFGAVAGSIATYFVMKQQMEPELEVVYEPNDEIKERIKDDLEKKVNTERKVVTESTKQEDEQDKKEYENIIRKYNHQLKKPEVDIRDMLNKKPYLISEEDYAAAPDSVKPALEEFRGVVWNKDKIREQMADAIAVAERYGVQLFCGEWGVYEPVDRELAYAWTKDMLEVFDEYNIAWTTWCYDADFGFWDQKAHDYKDKQLVELLMNNSKGLEE